MGKASQWAAIDAPAVADTDSFLILSGSANRQLPVTEARKVTGLWWSLTVNAAQQTGATNEIKIQNAINLALGLSAKRVFVPTSMLPYNAALITFDNSIQMVREGGDFTVWDLEAYGADPTGFMSAATSAQKANDAAAAAGGGKVHIGPGRFLIDTEVTQGHQVTFEGEGYDMSTLFRTSTNRILVCNGGNFQSGRHFRLDGGAASGPLIAFLDSNAFYGNWEEMFFTNYPATSSAVTFANNACPFGTFRRWMFEPTGAQTVVPCIQMAIDVGPTYRVFEQCLAYNGNPLIDVSEVEMMWLFVCTMATIIFSSANAKKVTLLGCRIATSGGTTTVKGINHNISACDFAGPVVLDSSTQGCTYAGNTDAGVTDNWAGVGTRNGVWGQGFTGAFLAFGGQSASHVALKRSGAGFHVRTGDDSGYGDMLMQSLTLSGGRFAEQAQAPTFGASVVLDCNTGNHFVVVVTSATAPTITFINPAAGQRIEVRLKNMSGGAMGATTWTGFKMRAATLPANGFSRTWTFRYDGTNMIERTPDGDVPN